MKIKLLRLFCLATFMTLLSYSGYGQCDYTLRMIDSYGDGWNGNTMDLLVNGDVVLDGVTVASTDNGGDFNEVNFNVSTDDEITTVWNGGGSFASETSYEIKDPNGNVVGSGAETSITTAISASCPSCLTPSNLLIDNITTNSADVSWDTSETSDGGYEYVIVPSGDGVESGTPVTETTTSVSVSELESNTAYDVYLRTICGEESSDWTSAVSFTTACEAFGDFTENFDDDAEDTVPNCWSTIVQTTSDFATADIYNLSSPNSGDNHFRMYNSADASAIMYFVTPELTDLPND
ncbi:MAG: fibronectin type III domain-containing protein, partial [Psychroflexus sp.]